MNKETMNKRTREMIAGVSIIAAYGVLGSMFTADKVVILGLEFASGIAVILAAVMLYPQLYACEKKLTTWFVVPRTLEGIVLAATAFLILPSASVFQQIRGLVYAVHSYVFVLTGILFYLILYRSRMIPRFVSAWGMGALGLLFTANVFEHAGAPLSFGVLFFLPIVANEVFLAVWLIIKGLQLPIACGSSRPELRPA